MDEVLVARYSRHIWEGAIQIKQRPGQYLFNQLPLEAAQVVANTPLDTYFVDLSITELMTWVNNHLVFEEGLIVVVFDGDKVIWQAPLTPNKEPNA